MTDLIIDRSDSQKQARVAEMRAELVDMGYAIVTTEWLQDVLRGLTVESLVRVPEMVEAE